MEFEDFASANIFHDTEVVVDPLLFSFWRPWKGNLLLNSLHVHCLETEVILFWKISVITNSERKFAESLNVFTGFILEFIGFKTKAGRRGNMRINFLRPNLNYKRVHWYTNASFRNPSYSRSRVQLGFKKILPSIRFRIFWE